MPLKENITPDSDSCNFEKMTPTPAENMRLHQLRLHNPSCHPECIIG